MNQTEGAGPPKQPIGDKKEMEVVERKTDMMSSSDEDEDLLSFGGSWEFAPPGSTALEPPVGPGHSEENHQQQQQQQQKPSSTNDESFGDKKEMEVMERKSSLGIQSHRFDTVEECAALWGNVSKAIDADKTLMRSVLELQTDLLTNVGDDAFVGTVEVPADHLSSICGRSVPLSAGDIDVLYEQGISALVGVEGKGDVLDETVRRTKEYDVSDIELPSVLADFEFPAARSTIQSRLCRTAERIRVTPYKLLFYGEGDFFGVHVDSMSDAMQFGSLALEIPISKEAMRPSAGRKNPSSAQSKEEKRQVSVAGTGGSGCLVLYCGGRSCADRLVGTDTANNMLRNRNGLYSPFSPHLDAQSLTVRLGSYRSDEYRADPKKDESGYLLRYAAWLGDIPHEVYPIEVGYRVVLIYRLYKEGNQESPLIIPRQMEFDRQISRLFQLLRDSKWSERVFLSRARENCPDGGVAGKCTVRKTADVGNVDDNGASYQVRHIGIILHHPYPPNGLQPNALKGIDAVAYQLFNRHHRCYLRNAFEARMDDMSAPFRLHKDSYEARDPGLEFFMLRKMFVSADLSKVQSRNDDVVTETIQEHPIVLDCIWMQLGFGCLLGGGVCYGNCDCGTDWWYRQAVLVVTQEPSNWSRRKGAFYLGMYGSPSMQWLYSVWDVFEQVVMFL